MSARVMSVEARFWFKVNKHGPKVPNKTKEDKKRIRLWPEIKDTNCWEYLGGKDNDGYGQFALSRTANVRAHRFAYESYTGKKLKKQGCHKCDNPGTDWVD